MKQHFSASNFYHCRHLLELSGSKKKKKKVKRDKFISLMVSGLHSRDLRTQVKSFKMLQNLRGSIELYCREVFFVRLWVSSKYVW